MKDLSIYEYNSWKNENIVRLTAQLQVFSDLTFILKISGLTENYLLCSSDPFWSGGGYTGKQFFLQHCLHALALLSDHFKKVKQSYSALYKWPRNFANTVCWNKCSLKYPICDLKVETWPKYVAILERSLAWWVK